MATNRKPERVFFIGNNVDGEFGIGHMNSQKELIKCELPITKIHSSYKHTFYADDNYRNIWFAGISSRGQSGISIEFDILKFEKVTYFKENNIEISNICASPSSDTTFFITKDKAVYGCGNNCGNQLGLVDTSLNHDISKPVLIPQLTNVIQVQSTNFSIALCASDDDQFSIIINNWCRVFKVPDDITSILTQFCKWSKVYSTVYTPHGHGGKYEHERHFGWKEIEFLNDKDIVKIVAGGGYSICLGSNGVVYSCGYNNVGELGIGGSKHEINIPTEISYFKNNNINIIDIETGYGHSLALDSDNNIYSWGFDSHGQCGNGTESEDDNILYTNWSEPVLIETLKDYKIDLIRCGHEMSYCKTECGKHFIWGSNKDNECLTYDDRDRVDVPFCVNGIIKEKCNTTRIIDIYPGYKSTKIICE